MNYYGNPEFLPVLTVEELRERGRAGGIKSGETRRRRAAFRAKVKEYMAQQDYIEKVVKRYKPKRKKKK